MVSFSQIAMIETTSTTTTTTPHRNCEHPTQAYGQRNKPHNKYITKQNSSDTTQLAAHRRETQQAGQEKIQRKDGSRRNNKTYGIINYLNIAPREVVESVSIAIWTLARGENHDHC